ncbi:MAG: hypothetical protein N3A02_05415, partial [Rectinema sp.]|nr:hypothetical protein [Rectinema sp.]
MCIRDRRDEHLAHHGLFEELDHAPLLSFSFSNTNALKRTTVDNPCIFWILFFPFDRKEKEHHNFLNQQ